MKTVRSNKLHSLWVAFGFLTRVPVGDPSRGGATPVQMSSAVPWFPIVGILIGLAQGFTWLALNEVTTPLLSAVIATAIAALITGAFHHDGLADIADAFGGGWTVEQRMEILKDSRLGTYGTTALIMAFGTEIAALSSLDPETGLRALVAAHVLGRGIAVGAMLVSPIGGDGLGASYMTDLNPLAGVCSLALSVVAGVALLGVTGAGAFVLAAVAAACVVLLAIKKIGGVTGDVLGAVFVMAFLATLVTAASG